MTEKQADFYYHCVSHCRAANERWGGVPRVDKRQSPSQSHCPQKYFEYKHSQVNSGKKDTMQTLNRRDGVAAQTKVTSGPGVTLGPRRVIS
jgi:hypothetical protein